jgi:hypothetical protein
MSVGVLILAWIAWRMIQRKTAAVLECAASQQARPDQTHANLPHGPLSRQTALDSQIVREINLSNVRFTP